MLLRSSDKNLLINQTSLLVSVGQLFCCLHVATPGTQVSNFTELHRKTLTEKRCCLVKSVYTVTESL